MSNCLLELTDLSRHFEENGGITAVRRVSIGINSGEWIAITGSSGSGKTSLLNIIGCLDSPTSGSYAVNGVDVANFDASRLAQVRRENFGFVFQKYCLLAGLSVLENVELPAVYSGLTAQNRRRRAIDLCDRLGLSSRILTQVTALSGGEQQRIAIARALINEANVILADEPTGALDKKNGTELMELFRELNGRGHTIIMNSHDRTIVDYASRVIEMSDGEIVSDRCSSAAESRAHCNSYQRAKAGSEQRRVAKLSAMRAAIAMAISSLRSQRLRSVLSTIGIAIGIAAISATLAIGSAVTAQFKKEFRQSLERRIEVQRAPWLVGGNAVAQIFNKGDIAALRHLADIQAVVPDLFGNERLRTNGRRSTMDVFGATASSATEFGKLIAGRSLLPIDIKRANDVVVLSQDAVRRLFSSGSFAIGRTVIIGLSPFRVIGVVGSVRGIIGDNVNVGRAAIVPFSAFNERLQSDPKINALSITLDEHLSDRSEAAVVRQIRAILEMRHGMRDFVVRSLWASYERSSTFLEILQAVISAIAAISLLVGGVGIMNIMLATVSERVDEIGLRMAIGARPQDVQSQFLVEAVTLCLMGGVVGLALWSAVELGINSLQSSLILHVPLIGILVAVSVCIGIGMLFGFAPAHRASRMMPREALAHE